MPAILTEAALLERILTSNPSKTTIDARGSYRAAYSNLRAVDLQLFAPRYIQFCLGRSFDSDLALARSVTSELVKERKVPLRIVENLTAMVLGVHLFEEFAAECGIDLPEDLGMQEAVDAIIDDVVETDHGVKNALDHFLEMLGVMAVQKILKPRIHYAITSEGHLAVHLESAYDAFRAHAKRIDYDRELVDLKAMRRMITENRLQEGFVIDEGRKVCFAGKEWRRRAVLIDFAKTNSISVEDFPTDDDDGPREGFRSRYGWNDPS